MARPIPFFSSATGTGPRPPRRNTAASGAARATRRAPTKTAISGTRAAPTTSSRFRAHAVTRNLEDVVGAALVPEIAVFVGARLVARAAPLAAVFLRGGLGPVPVAEEKNGIGRAIAPRAANGHVAHLSRGQRLALLVDHRDEVTRIRAPHRSGLHGPEGLRVSDDVVHLGLPEDLVHRRAEAFLRPVENGGTERLAAAHERAKAHVEARAWLGKRLHHHLERRREKERVANGVLLHEAQRALGIEPAEKAEDRLAVVHRRHQRVPQAAGPGPVGGRPESIAWLRKAIMRVLEAGQVADQRAVRKERSLRRTRGSARVDDGGRIQVPRRDRVEVR